MINYFTLLSDNKPVFNCYLAFWLGRVMDDEKTAFL